MQSRSADGDRGEKLNDFKKETSALHFIRARKSFKKGEEKCRNTIYHNGFYSFFSTVFWDGSGKAVMFLSESTVG